MAIFKPDRLGDFILAAGAIQYVRELFGPENCVIIVADFVVGLAQKLYGDSQITGVPFAHNDLINGIIPGLWKARPRLVPYRFDQVLCLRHQRTIYQELLLGRIAASSSVGIENRYECLLPSDRGIYEFPFTRACAYPTAAPPTYCRELEANRLVVSLALGREVEIERVLPRLKFPTLAENLDDTIVVSPFASTDIRTYPPALLVEVLRLVQQQRDMRFLLCGSAGDASRLEAIARQAGQAGVRHVQVHRAGSFVDFCSLIATARGVISVDTATAHVATALDKPAAIILGGGQYGDFGPWSRSSRQVWSTHPVPCFGCSWDCMHPEPLCITQVPPEAIASAIVERL